MSVYSKNPTKHKVHLLEKAQSFNFQKMVFLQRVICLINSALIAETETERDREIEREDHKITNISERI